MMHEYEPGRVYSGIVDGKRQIVFCDSEHWHHVDAAGVLCGGGHFNGSYTDVRGPLVVLDLNDAPVMPGDLISTLREGQLDAEDWLADQIEEQTRPPLQIGYHDAACAELGKRAVMWFDGTHWKQFADYAGASAFEWTSTHFIGPASDAS